MLIRSMTNHQLESLMKWLNTFDLKTAYSVPEDICDGVALAEVLAQIAPHWFISSWQSKIKTDVGTNWRLRVSNLKKIVEAVVEYYSECLNQPLSGYTKPDASKIGEHCDVTELRKLLQLILGCAVNCSQKQLYITRIMRMEVTIQQAIMQNIQELEFYLPGPKLSSGASFNLESINIGPEGCQDLMSELQRAINLNDQLGQKCHELDQQLSLLQEEKATLLNENKKLQERLDEFDNADQSLPSLRYSGLRKQVEDLKDEIFKIETSRDDYRMKVEILTKEVFVLQSKQDELQKIADEANNLKDELDALRETADKATKYELTIESYKKKMEDLSDLKRQVKILEDKNMEYMQSKIEYEEEIKRSSTVRNHLELCKQQLAESQRKLDEQINKCDRLEFDAKKLEAQLNSAHREKERLIIERDALKETNEELKCTQLHTAENATPAMLHDVSTTELISPEIKEKLVLLEHENKMLRLEQLGHDEKLPTIEALLDDSEQRLNVLRDKHREATQKIMELENKLEEVNEHQREQNRDSKVDNNGFQYKIQQLQNESKQFQTERERFMLQIEEKDAAIQTLKQKIFTLSENLARKEFENAALEERSKKNIEKAKAVIKCMDPKQSNYPSELLLLRNQVLEKRRIIDDMERSLKESKLLGEMEEKLMISAFYQLGFTCQREMVDQRLANFSSSQGNSFLARQRQPSARRTIHSSVYNSK